MSWKRIRWRLPLLLAPAMLAAALGRATAQQAPATLSLQEAIDLARRYNPDYRTQLNDQGVSDWQVAEAFANLLPAASLNTRFSYTMPGTPRIIEGLDANQFGISRQPPAYNSSYGFNLGLGLSGATYFNLAQSRANRSATDARVSAAAYTLDADVTREYLAAMRSRDGVTVARQDLETARESKKLADARYAGGVVTQIDPAQAEVAVGRSEVLLIQAENLHEADKLRLLQRLGLTLDRDLQLTTQLEVFEPTWTREELLRTALADHPQLRSARASEDASLAAARAAKMSYLPSLFLSAGWAGSAREVGDRNAILNGARSNVENQRENCISNNRILALLGDPQQDCTRHVYTDERGQAALAANDVFPFNFTGQPASFAAGISIPIFNGLTRERQMQQSRADADDARHRRRAAELNQQTVVATAYGNAMAARKSVDIEQRNVKAADLQLNLARDRYRLGGGQFLDLANAQQSKAQADRAYLNALYQFHESVAALEAAAGRPLRQK
ncbi:MAG: TolC family protein [Longimicrobiales bacterium]